MIVKVATAKKRAMMTTQAMRRYKPEGKQAEGDVGLIRLRNLVPDILQRRDDRVGRIIGGGPAGGQKRVADRRGAGVQSGVAKVTKSFQDVASV